MVIYYLSTYRKTMSLSTIFKVASQGMSVQRERLETATSNLANSNTTRTAEGGPYRRRDIVLEAVPLEESQSSFGSLFGTSLKAEHPTDGVRATTLIADPGNGPKRYQPDHPDADTNGYVTMPDVDPLEETVNLLSAARSFEANATAFTTAKEMARASLKLGEA
jgi:flagellar basal-body rod protein FlgC